MSASSTSSGLSGNAESSTDLAYKDALIIGAAVIGVLMVLVASKVGLYFVLDLCCDLDGGERRRQVREFLRRLLPFWNVRTQPQLDGDNDEMDNRETLTLEILNDRLPSHILTEEDVRLWKKEEALEKSEHGVIDVKDEIINNDPSESDKSELVFPCSICLVDMKAGDKVFRSTGCSHLYHYDCFATWAVRGSASKQHIECPNCRTRIGWEEP